MIITTANAQLYALAIIAYAAFDLVVVGLVFTVVSMLTIDLLLWGAKQPLVTRPFTYYAQSPIPSAASSASCYGLGCGGSGAPR